jgi:hypothetical protein
MLDKNDSVKRAKKQTKEKRTVPMTKQKQPII